MAIYKIFPKKDTTLYSLDPTMNTGLDEILEASTYFGNSNSPQVSRILIQFDDNEINNVLSKIGNNTYQANLKLFAANIEGLNTSSIIYTYLCAKNWAMGTGKYTDIPVNENGASWTYTSTLTKWIDTNEPYSASFGTSSYNYTSSYDSEIGGGVWVTSTSQSFALSSSYSFSYRTSKDINVDVTSMLYNSLGSGSIEPILPNYGFLIKQPEEQEFVNSISEQLTLKYFSTDTHTIYPPQLEFKWDDSSWVTGSLSVLNDEYPYVNLGNNKVKFNQNESPIFRVFSRPKYPPRVFQTSSFYNTNYYLPENSYYAIKDLKTNEFVVDFDPNYTKISADEKSSYFKIYMDGLEPERYYKILISSSIDNSEYIFDNDYFFKVING